jgi:hypothetical protein
MTEYKKIVEEQAQKIQEENNNNALIGFGWQRESEGSPHVVRFKGGDNGKNTNAN